MFFGVLHAGGSDVRAEKAGQLVNAFRALQTDNDRERPRFGGPFGHLEMRGGAGGDLRHVADA